MRLWSLHPRYLDANGLMALWREGLLAQEVLAGETKVIAIIRCSMWCRVKLRLGKWQE